MLKFFYSLFLLLVVGFFSVNPLQARVDDFEVTAFPTDPQYFQQWQMSQINVRNAWSKLLLARETENITTRSIIAVLDTGVDLDHPDLENKIWQNKKEIPGNNIDDDRNGYIDDVNGWDFVDNDNDSNPAFKDGFVTDALQHGTLVAGLAAAEVNNAAGIAGVSWFSDIMPLRVLDHRGSGDILSVIEAIDYAVANGADIINMSFVGNNFSTALLQSIQRAYAKGVVVVAAAGNTNPSLNGTDLDITKSYPVCFDDSNGDNIVIGVASIAADQKKSRFSSYGSCIDIVAPGESFFSTQVLDPQFTDFRSLYGGYWSGTSLSTPLVSGVFGLVKSLRPNIGIKNLQRAVLQSANSVEDKNQAYSGDLGSGVVNAESAIEYALSKQMSLDEGGVSNYIVAGLGNASFPQLKIFDDNGKVFKEFFAYSPFFTGDVNVATGDIDGDGKDEIITGAGPGGGPHVRVFNTEGHVLAQFFAYDSSSRGGVTVATGDIDGDGKDEIITGAGKGVSPEVKIFNSQGEILGHFLAYGQNSQGGVNVASGDVNRDGKDEIITGAGSGGGPHVRVFNTEGHVLAQFFAYNKNFNGGVNVASGDVNGDGIAEIVASIEKKSSPEVRIFTMRGVMLESFFAFESDSLSGVELGVGDVDGDGVAEIVAGKGGDGDSVLRIYNQSGRIKKEFNAHTSGYTGGARSAVLRK